MKNFVNYKIKPLSFLYWIVGLVVVTAIFSGCSRKFHKEDADKEVYRIMEEKWQDDFGGMDNYKVSDSTPNDVEILKEVPPSRVLNLQKVVEMATKYNRDYQREKESLYLSILDLTLTRYRYTLQWFGTIDGTYVDDKIVEDDVTLEAEGGADQAALFLGGVLFNAGIMVDWTRFLTGDPRNALGSVLSGDISIPLLGSGAGKAARENLTQAERNALYRIRTFNRYRKTFVVSIINDYYDVLQQKESLEITRASYERQVESTKQLRMEAEVGQRAQSDVDEAEQRLLSVENNLVSAQQRYAQRLDTFKIRLSLPSETDIVLDQNDLAALGETGIKYPEYSVEDAIAAAMVRRLDLANTKDQLEDTSRQLELAAEGLGVQLNLIGRVDVTSLDGETDIERLQFHEGIYQFGFAADLPLDRKAERNAYREALIGLEQRKRGYDEEIERVKLAVRQAYRDLTETAESYRIQKIGAQLAERRVEEQKLLLEYGRGTVRLLLESEDALVEAQNQVTEALVNHTIARLSFFRDIGILQVRPDGMWEQNTQ